MSLLKIPLRRKLHCVHSRNRRSETIGRCLPKHRRVPSMSFHLTTTVYSTMSLQVCCTLLPAMGFAAFRKGSKSNRPQQRGPFEAFPSLAAVLCHHSLCPPAVASLDTHRCRHEPVEPTSRLCSTRKSVTSCTVASTFSTLLPWAFVQTSNPIRQTRPKPAYT